MASTIWPPTRAGSTWVSTTTPRPSPPKASGGGGRAPDGRVTLWARRLLITADVGGSNGARTWLWKRELQRLADEIGLEMAVCHFSPGTSKWNKIEHRLFSFSTQNWRGRPLVSYAVILSLIATTTTATGLSIESYLDTNSYPTGVKVTDVDMAAIRLEPDPFHGEWNYTILPHAAGYDDFIR